MRNICSINILQILIANVKFRRAVFDLILDQYTFRERRERKMMKITESQLSIYNLHDAFQEEQ